MFCVGSWRKKIVVLHKTAQIFIPKKKTTDKCICKKLCVFKIKLCFEWFESTSRASPKENLLHS